MGTYLCVCVLGVYNVAIYVYVVVHNYVNLITSTKKREGRERECVCMCVFWGVQCGNLRICHCTQLHKPERDRQTETETDRDTERERESVLGCTMCQFTYVSLYTIT